MERELDNICNEIIQLIDSKLLPKADSAEDRAFYLKMKGDYFRYITEYATDVKNKEAAKNASLSYEEATEEAEELTSIDPIKLGLALNFSVFYYEVRNNVQMACEVARKAFDEAIDNIDELEEGKYKDSTILMQIIRDNLAVWKSELDDVADAKTEKN